MSPTNKRQTVVVVDLDGCHHHLTARRIRAVSIDGALSILRMAEDFKDVEETLAGWAPGQWLKWRLLPQALNSESKQVATELEATE